MLSRHGDFGIPRAPDVQVPVPDAPSPSAAGRSFDLARSHVGAPNLSPLRCLIALITDDRLRRSRIESHIHVS